MRYVTICDLVDLVTYDNQSNGRRTEVVL